MNLPKTEREIILNEWREAYRKANGKEPPMIVNNFGWYHLLGSYTKYRINQFPAMTERLLERVKDEST